MSDEAAPKRRGRPPKKRHDADAVSADAPLAGNPGIDVVYNKEPGFVYPLVSDDDMAIMLARGAVVCQRGNEQARPHEDRYRDAGDFKVRGLTMMKISVADYEKYQSQPLAI